MYQAAGSGRSGALARTCAAPCGIDFRQSESSYDGICLSVECT